MLNRRMHILFDEETANFLAAHAKEKAVSVGDLVRRAVRDVYAKGENQALRKRKKLVSMLLRHQKQYLGRFEGLDYRVLIEDGRTR